MDFLWADPQVLSGLGWDYLMEYVSEFALSLSAKKLFKEQKTSPMLADSVQACQVFQDQTEEASSLLAESTLWDSLKDLQEITPNVERVVKGSFFSQEELMVLRGWLYVMDHWKKNCANFMLANFSAPYWIQSANQIMHPYDVLSKINRIIEPAGTISPSASPELKRLYRERAVLRESVQRALGDTLQDLGSQGFLQSEFSDKREGRVLIPVKIQFFREVEGILVDTSASGQTAYIEPKKIGILNEKLRVCENEILIESIQVLKALSAELLIDLPKVSESIQILIQWDCIRAKACVAQIYQGKKIKVEEHSEFNWQGSAHPLLWWSLNHDQITKNTLIWKNPHQVLLLTGPNTGGKTVFLKTLGLAALCARAGFFFPGDESPEIPFFDALFLDMGDPQSLTNDLSSFAGHLLNINRILKQLTPCSLVLLDELNSSTDPDEGSALSRALLEFLMDQKVKVVATSHDPGLKLLASQDPRILNGSLAFDEQLKKPTHRLILGVAGRSRAFETAERLGLNPEILSKAKSYMSRDHLNFEAAIAKLELNLKELMRDQEALKEEQRTLELQRQAFEIAKKQWEDQSRQRIQSSIQNLEASAKLELSQKIKKYHQEHQSEKKIQSWFHKTLESFQHATLNELGVAPQGEASLLRFQIGDQAIYSKWKVQGKVLEVKEDEVLIRLGTLSKWVPQSELEPVEGLKTSKVQMTWNSIPNVQSQIDLRGVRVQEAIGEVDRFLNRAILANAFRVKIIFGVGSGALRNAVLNFLSEWPLQKEFEMDGPGACWVQLGENPKAKT